MLYSRHLKTLFQAHLRTQEKHFRRYNMKNSRIIVLIGFLSLVFYFLSGCQSKNEPAAPAPTPTVCSAVLGNDTNTNDATIGAGFLIGTPYTAGSSATVAKIKAKLNDVSSFIAGIYTDNSGEPGTLLNQSAISSGTAGWNIIDIPATPLVSGTAYWLVFTAESAAVAMLSGGSSNTVKSYAYAWSSVTGSGLPSAPAGWAVVDTTSELKICALSCD
jgi:hypothetical protein